MPIKESQPPKPAQTQPSIQHHDAQSSVSKPNWKIDVDLVGIEAVKSPPRIKYVVATRFPNKVQYVHKTNVNSMVTLVRRVENNQGHPKQSNQ